MAAGQTQSIGQAGSGDYFIRPASANGKGVLVLHAWWGLNPFMREFCDRLGREGFNVLAPDLYGGMVAHTITEAEALRAKLKRPLVIEKVLTAAGDLASLCSQPQVGVVGFSLGGWWALWLAEQTGSPVAAAVIFYGSRGGKYATNQVAFQFHLAESDPYVAASGVKQMQKSFKAAGRLAEFYTYAGTGHWFFEEDRTDVYAPQAAALAWNRSVDFLKAHI